MFQLYHYFFPTLCLLTRTDNGGEIYGSKMKMYIHKWKALSIIAYLVHKIRSATKIFVRLIT
ncbi:TPA: hypothetical protein MHP97_13520 [Klebsiella quasipneumoniae subsp. similipneumoniae]|nr:hypothetical protein [Klebsiella quasipneumoniae subsp. similipneumoniae]HBX1661741.1 hypothetical protein [Klebsiella quasipneumoniae subsp. similipneumoniae]HBX1723955.1 hypothetical protein [Klebsiella quasipneumoniae subsp. similipneumoniae]